MISLKSLPDEIIFEIEKKVYHSIHQVKYKNILNEFKNNILEETDMGSIILYRIDGMPLLIYD